MVSASMKVGLLDLHAAVVHSNNMCQFHFMKKCQDNGCVGVTSVFIGAPPLPVLLLPVASRLILSTTPAQTVYVFPLSWRLNSENGS
jgi:hypothetical protein